MPKTLNNWQGHTPPKTERLGGIYKTNKGSTRPIKKPSSSPYNAEAAPR